MFKKLVGLLGLGNNTPPAAQSTDAQTTDEMEKRFRRAAIYGDIETVKQILAQDPSLVSVVDKYGFTTLHEVVGEHSVEMVVLLIQAGADVNAQNDDGIAPLHLAAYDDIAEALLQAGATLEMETQNGETPLYIHAAEADSEDVIHVLLRHGADPHKQNKDGQSPLDVAIARDENEKVQLMSQES